MDPVGGVVEVLSLVIPRDENHLPLFKVLGGSRKRWN